MLTNYYLIENFWFKTVLCILCGYLFSSGAITLFLKHIASKGRFHQPIREVGPQSHLLKKNTPTMGGIFIVLSTIISSFLLLDLSTMYIWIMLMVFITFSLIGLTDDLMKVIYKNPQGFRGSIKLVIQFLIIGIAYIWLDIVNPTHATTRVFLPFGGVGAVTLGTLYVLFIAIVIVGTANAVNLTDGLDGLVSVPVIISLICLMVLVYIASNSILSYSFHVPFIRNSLELLFFNAILIGAVLGFLQHNLRPAKIFMGDVGSLAIGSALGLNAVIIKQEAIFFIIALLFVIEALSVILQVSSYKLRKKRIFLMSPLHHHFEKLGWSENIVVRRFWIISLFCALLGMLIFVLHANVTYLT